jgi:hypothetical protein
MLKQFACRLATNFRKQFVSRRTHRSIPKLFAGRLAINFRKQFLSRTVCLVEDSPIQCSNCLLADWRRIFANSFSRGGPPFQYQKCLQADCRLIFANSLSRGGLPYSMFKLFACRLATNFRKQFLSRTVCLVEDSPIQCSNYLLAECRLATNFCKQFVSRRTPQFTPRFIYPPASSIVGHRLIQ